PSARAARRLPARPPRERARGHEPRIAASIRSDEAGLGRPAGQLVTLRELQLSQDARDVALDGLHGDVEPGGDLLVEVPACDQLEDLALSRGELVELTASLLGAVRVEDEARKPGREDRVAGRHPLDRRRELLSGDRLRHVAARTG